MKTLLIILAAFAAASIASLRADPASDLKASLTAEQWQQVNVFWLAQRATIVAAHESALASAAAGVQAQLDTASTALARKTAEFDALNARVTEVLQSRIEAARQELQAELNRGGAGPKSAAIQARIDELQGLAFEAGKSSAQKALDDAKAAEAAATAARKAAEAALNNP